MVSTRPRRAAAAKVSYVEKAAIESDDDDFEDGQVTPVMARETRPRRSSRKKAKSPQPEESDAVENPASNDGGDDDGDSDAFDPEEEQDDDDFDEGSADDSDFEEEKPKKKKAPAKKKKKKATTTSKGKGSKRKKDSENSDTGNKKKKAKKAAPKKQKKAKTGLDASMVMTYFEEQNRPFSVSQVAQKFFHEATRGGIIKVLEALVGEGELCKNEKNCYWLDQKRFAPQTEEEEAAEIEEMKALADEVKRITGVKSELLRRKAKLQSEPTDALLDRLVAEMRAAKDAKSNEVTQIKNDTKASEDGMSEEDAHRVFREKDNLMREFKFYRGMWKNRKDTCEDFMAMMMEHSTKKLKKAAVEEEIGIETDEEIGVSLKTFKSVM